MLRLFLLLTALTLASGSAHAALASNALASNALSATGLAAVGAVPFGDAEVIDVVLPHE